MEIIEVSIDNYKSFSNFKRSGFRSMNMLFGYNNSGKSNFLKFIELVFNRKDTIQTITYYDDGIRKERTELSTGNFWEGSINDMPFFFRNDDRRKIITFEFRFKVMHTELSKESKTSLKSILGNHDYSTVNIKGSIIEENVSVSKIRLENVILNRKTIYQSSAKGIEYFKSISGLEGNKEIFEKYMAIFNDCVLFLENDRNICKETETTDMQYVLSSKNIKNWLHNISMTAEKYEDYLLFIKFIKQFQINCKKDSCIQDNEKNSPITKADIGFVRLNGKIEIMLRNDTLRLPLSNYGTGIQQIFYILTKLYFSTSKVVLIEELELNLSPKFQEEILEHFKKLISKNRISQIIFSTHSPYFNNRDDFRLFEAVINDKGVTDINKCKAERRKEYFKIHKPE